MGGFASGDIVITGVKDNYFRFVRQDDSPFEINYVWDLRAAESAINYIELAEAFAGRPQADAWAAHEQDGVRRERVLFIPILEGADFFLPSRGLVISRWFGSGIR